MRISPHGGGVGGGEGGGEVGGEVGGEGGGNNNNAAPEKAGQHPLASLTRPARQPSGSDGTITLHNFIFHVKDKSEVRRSYRQHYRVPLYFIQK